MHAFNQVQCPLLPTHPPTHPPPPLRISSISTPTPTPHPTQSIRCALSGAPPTLTHPPTYPPTHPPSSPRHLLHLKPPHPHTPTPHQPPTSMPSEHDLSLGRPHAALVQVALASPPQHAVALVEIGRRTHVSAARSAHPPAIPHTTTNLHGHVGGAPGLARGCARRHLACVSLCVHDVCTSPVRPQSNPSTGPLLKRPSPSQRQPQSPESAARLALWSCVCVCMCVVVVVDTKHP